MDLLELDNVGFRGLVGYKGREYVFEELAPFSHHFAYGKSFLLDSYLGMGAWALSWLIGGFVEADQGSIKRNSVIYSTKDRKRDSWSVRKSEIKRFIFDNQTVKWQIQHGLRSGHKQYFGSEEEFIHRFILTPERYVRRFSTLSHEAWRASCAIGLANGRTIFCFPYLRRRDIEEWSTLWLPTVISALKDAGSLVLIPTKATRAIENLCDEIVSLSQGE